VGKLAISPEMLPNDGGAISGYEYADFADAKSAKRGGVIALASNLCCQLR
jgi:hypothetical protein